MSASDPSSSASSEMPWGQRTRSVGRRRETELMFQVLDNPSLREEIVKHAIIGGDKKVDHRTACSLRRVGKSWNESVLRILWKANEPLYQLVLGDGGNLGAFTKTFAASSAISALGPPPPLNLGHLARLTQRADLESFSNFMISCGPALLQLGPVIIEDFGEPVPIVLPPWSLSRLHKVEIIVGFRHRQLLAPGEQPEAEAAAGQEKISECLIKSIFLGATALAELVLSVDHWLTGYPADVSIFDSITFPPTLVKLKLEIDLELQQAKDFVNAVLKCPLPKVTSLALMVWTDIFEDGILLSLMDKWKSSLNNLVIVANIFVGPPINFTTIRFPVMDQLVELSISSICAELETGLRSLENCFPKLHTLRLRSQTLGMLRKWTESSRCSGVTCVELTLAFDQRDLSLGMKAMQLINSAFPNLRKLELGIFKWDPSGLWYVFQEMRELVELKVTVYSYISLEGTTDEWDSILTGVPVNAIASIRRRGPDSQEDGRGVVPITNLKELKSLSVKYGSDPLPGSVISDFIFEHAFLRMPKLTHLHFEGPLKVSQEMTDKWMGEEGRSLGYQRFSSSY